MSNLLKNLVIVLVISIILWIGYVFFIRKSDEAPLSVTSGAANQAQVESQQLLSTIQKLKSYNVKSTIFSDPRFVSLTDFRVQLMEEPVGRKNPFAPIQ